MEEQTVGELLKGRVTLDLEGIDRLYLNLDRPRLQTGGGVVTFFKVHRAAKFCAYFPSTARVCLNGHEYRKRQLAKEDGLRGPGQSVARLCRSGPRATVPR